MSKFYHLRLRRHWVSWRNAMLSDARFQHRAARCWLTRRVAQAKARASFDLVAGFVYSQILAASVESGLLSRLADGPSSIERLALACDLPPASALRLLRAAATLRLVERLGDDWALGSVGAAIIGNAGVSEMIAHHRLLYADLADPVAVLRRGGGGGALSRYWAYAEHPGESDVVAVEDYSRLMAASQPLVARQIIDAYRFGRHRRMLDIGGGEGRFIESVGTRFPDIMLALFDLPGVTVRAVARLATTGLLPRTVIHSGDFLIDPLPQGYDLITLVRVLHDHDDGPALALLRAIHSALPPGGCVVIAEPMAGARGAEPAGDGYFGFYLFAMGSGRPRMPREIHAMLRLAGFDTVRTLTTAMPLTCGVISARRSR